MYPSVSGDAVYCTVGTLVHQVKLWRYSIVSDENVEVKP
jgi:hypothetical protein